jgi:SAM-dependent methyltransferase
VHREAMRIEGLRAGIWKICMKTYAKLCTEFYDLEQHPNHAQALAFYLHHAHQAHGPILEPMCGTGRFLIPMLQAGLDVRGFDASSHMLDALRNKYACVSVQPAPVWQQFIQDLARDTRYTLIFIPYGSFGLITDRADVIKSLAVLYRHLVPGGKFIVDVETVASVPNSCGVRQRGVHVRPDGSSIALTFLPSYDSQTQLFQSHSRYESISGDTVLATEDELFQQYLYRCDELDPLLQAAGFSIIKKYPAYDATKKVDHTTPIIVYECVR